MTKWCTVAPVATWPCMQLCIHACVVIVKLQPVSWLGKYLVFIVGTESHFLHPQKRTFAASLHEALEGKTKPYTHKGNLQESRLVCVCVFWSWGWTYDRCGSSGMYAGLWIPPPHWHRSSLQNFWKRCLCVHCCILECTLITRPDCPCTMCCGEREMCGLATKQDK